MSKIQVIVINAVNVHTEKVKVTNVRKFLIYVGHCSIIFHLWYIVVNNSLTKL